MAEIVSRPQLLAYCRKATPGRMWSSHAVDALHSHVTFYAEEMVANIGLNDPTHYGTHRRVTPEDVLAAIENRKSAYTRWLEEVVETYAQALRANGVAKPKTRPAPTAEGR